MKNRCTLLIALCVMVINSFAQTSYTLGEKCGMNQVQAELEALRPQSIQELKDFQQIIQQYSSKQTPGRATTLTIPVVVHVICLSTEAVGTGRNLTDARVQAQIAILNRDFMALNSNWTSGTPSVFQSVRGIPEVQFCLANKDPSGNATTGIVRHNYSDPTSTNTIENTIKPATSWNATKYFNIWTIAIPGTSSLGGTLGYAYLPTSGMVGSNIDGVVIDYRWFGSPTIAAVSGDCRALTHETGHYLGLNHIWGNTTSSHVCTDDDGIADTPLQSGPTANNTSFNCSSGSVPTSCSGVQNMFCDYMDYLNDDACYSTFSQGQVNVMRNVVQGTPVTVNGTAYVGRSSLLTSQVTVCAPSLTIDAGITAHITPANLSTQCGTAAITPQVTSKNFGLNTLTSVTIRYQVNGGAATSFSWTGSLATNATTNVTLAPFTPPAGTFTFKSFTSLPNGSTDQNTLNDSLKTTHSATGFSSLPFSEDFSATNFNPTVNGITVTQSPTDAWTWTRSTSSAYGTGTGCAIMDNYASTGTTTTNPSGTLDNLVTPTFSFAGVSNATLTFDVAYAPYIGTNSFYDSLAVLVSTDCGTTYTQRIFYSGGASLATATGINTAFTPTGTQWVNKSISLASLNGQSNVTFAFRSISDWGNNLYIDNINIASTTCALTATTSGTSTSCGLANGTATVTPSGGGTYTYLWSNGGSTATISNLAAATYTVTVTSGGCSTTASRVVNASTGITATTSGTATTCGLANGTATVTPSGGTTYTYLWSNGGSTATISNLAAATYTVTVTSAGCTTTASTVVNASTGITPRTIGNATTCGLSNGTATVILTGGSTYTYLWSNGGSTATISNLAAATYTVTVTSAGCTTTSSFIVNTSTAITATTSGSATTCGLSNGTATVTPSGGSTYTYLWNNGGVTATTSSLAAATYTVTVTSGGCSTTASRVVNTSAGITATASGTATTCGLANGTATVTPSGGSTYTYLWSNGGSTATISNLAAATYTVTVTSGGCSTTVSGVVNASSGITATTSGNATTCALSNGTATVTPSGGSTYTYLWSNGGNTATISNLAATTYTVTVISGGCSTTVSRVVYASTGITATTSGNATTCGLSNGTAKVTPSGASTYTYLWSNGGSTATISNLSAATYTVTVTTTGCTTTASRVVNASTGITATASGTAATSCSTANGTATVTPSGGSTYTYLWSNGGSTATISNLSAGTYKVTVTSSGCTTTASYTVSAPNSVTASTSGNATTCGLSNGSATVSPSGGSTYTYSWSNGGSTATISNLAAGSYTVTVSSNGCSTTATYTVAGSTGLTATTSSTPVTTQPNNGTATVTASGGTQPYTYAWSNGNSSDIIANVAAGQYTVTVTDVSSCPAVVKTVTVGSALSIASVANTTRFNIYPNPTEKELNIEMECTQCDDVTIELLGMNGQLVYRQFLEINKSKKATLNLEDLAVGLYCVRIQTSEGQYTYRVIKQ